MSEAEHDEHVVLAAELAEDAQAIAIATGRGDALAADAAAFRERVAAAAPEAEIATRIRRLEREIIPAPPAVSAYRAARNLRMQGARQEALHRVVRAPSSRTARASGHTALVRRLSASARRFLRSRRRRAAVSGAHRFRGSLLASTAPRCRASRRSPIATSPTSPRSFPTLRHSSRTALSHAALRARRGFAARTGGDISRTTSMLPVPRSTSCRACWPSSGGAPAFEPQARGPFGAARAAPLSRRTSGDQLGATAPRRRSTSLVPSLPAATRVEGALAPLAPELATEIEGAVPRASRPSSSRRGRRRSRARRRRDRSRAHPRRARAGRCRAAAAAPRREGGRDAAAELDLVLRRRCGGRQGLCDRVRDARSRRRRAKAAQREGARVRHRRPAGSRWRRSSGVARRSRQRSEPAAAYRPSPVSSSASSSRWSRRAAPRSLRLSRLLSARRPTAPWLVSIAVAVLAAWIFGQATRAFELEGWLARRPLPFVGLPSAAIYPSVFVCAAEAIAALLVLALIRGGARYTGGRSDRTHVAPQGLTRQRRRRRRTIRRRRCGRRAVAARCPTPWRRPAEPRARAPRGPCPRPRPPPPRDRSPRALGVPRLVARDPPTRGTDVGIPRATRRLSNQRCGDRLGDAALGVGRRREARERGRSSPRQGQRSRLHRATAEDRRAARTSPGRAAPRGARGAAPRRRAHPEHRDARGPPQSVRTIQSTRARKRHRGETPEAIRSRRAGSSGATRPTSALVFLPAGSARRHRAKSGRPRTRIGRPWQCSYQK